ncbi:NAD(P)-binding domain-containing protein [Neptuniibacter sp.]|uniref:NAD(P)-binding domain-containing protein n=1 Tax=Neptuniibacter sp. TaxID=1962643 RepID=UPI0026354900|nr:NAD(P)-binding domain-containing protein [Neptuniibacter sp.]MCP4597221.1 NAD(P)-dependent oxidoreductase [Neptuniibacter sp.]
MKSRIGILHPGEMGISVAVSAKLAGNEVYWCEDNRSDATRHRAEKYGITALSDIGELCQRCSIIIAVCPPQFAVETAYKVAEEGFTGIYLDANAIAPETALIIEELFSKTDINFVDGGIVGPPAWKKDRTKLYLSGPAADLLANILHGGNLSVKVIGEQIGQASAFKMCHSGHSKAFTALMLSVMSAAEAYGVYDQLLEHWQEERPDVVKEAGEKIERATPFQSRNAGDSQYARL